MILRTGSQRSCSFQSFNLKYTQLFCKHSNNTGFHNIVSYFVDYVAYKLLQDEVQALFWLLCSTVPGSFRMKDNGTEIKVSLWISASELWHACKCIWSAEI